MFSAPQYCLFSTFFSTLPQKSLGWPALLEVGKSECLNHMGNGEKAYISCSPKDWKIKIVPNKNDNMHSFVKVHNKKSVMKKMSHKRHNTPEFLLYY